MITLPIDSHLPLIKEKFQKTSALIIQASPGSGKTTRIPPSLLSIVSQKILVLEPRRLAAKLSANRVAEEMGEIVGETVGYRMRYESAVSPKTRLEFITEGLFSRILLSNPSLSGVGCVVLDEFHERHIHVDVALALIRCLQSKTRPDLKLVIMSATIDLNKIKTIIKEADSVTVEGRVFPVVTEYLKDHEIKSLPNMAVAAIMKLLSDSRSTGHVLAFLPGASDIRKSKELLLSRIGSTSEYEVFELRADIPKEIQKKIFAPSNKRKIILSTNVAETSITIDGVTGVVDSGLAKMAGYAHWSGLSTLRVRPVSQASCIQRAGRAGRTAPGVVIRLFPERDFFSRDPFEKPEIERLDLIQLVLELRTLLTLDDFQNARITELPWMETPPISSLASAERTLKYLGAITQDGDLTETGHQMARYPIHPRLARMVIEAKKSNYAETQVLSLFAACLLNEGGIFNSAVKASHGESCDVQVQIELANQCISETHNVEIIDKAALKRVLMLFHQLSSLAEVEGRSLTTYLRNAGNAELKTIILCGFPDRVAEIQRMRKDGDLDLALAQGGSAILWKHSAAKQSPFIIAIDAEEVDQQHGTEKSSIVTKVTLATGIESEILWNDPAGFLQESNDVFWDQEKEKVKCMHVVKYGNLFLDKSPHKTKSGDVSQILLKALKESWPKPFENSLDLQILFCRLKLLQELGFKVNPPSFSEENLDVLWHYIVEGKESFSDILQRPLNDYLTDLVPSETFSLLERITPRTITLRSGRRIIVQYEPSKPPWISSRLQDFFGTASIPLIAEGRLPLVIHLLAPNKQPVQVTKDLSGFWKTVYPKIRTQLARRYPKHSWPEDPLKANPPAPGKLR